LNQNYKIPVTKWYIHWRFI